MAKVDSIDKIVSTYFYAVTNEPFEYKGKTYQPKSLTISPLLLRGFTCPEMCAGCCPRFSLDYLPGSQMPYELERRLVSFNGTMIEIFSDLQLDNTSYHCINVDKKGRCSIHGKQPFSCDFELIRFLIFSDETAPNHLVQKLFGRGFSMMRIGGERGALCKMTPATKESINEVVRKLRLLEKWCLHFGLQKNKVKAIIDYVIQIAPYVNHLQVKSLTL
jgi:hypothetical protein